MGVPKKQHIDFGENYKGSYIAFSSVGAYHDFVAEQTAKLHPRNADLWRVTQRQASEAIMRRSTWFGTPVPTTLADLETHSHFLAMHKVEELKSKVRNHLKRFLKKLRLNIVQKPQLVINDKGLGVFSFDRAAMGLYRLQPTATHPPLEGLITQLKIATDTGNKATSLRSTFLHFENNTNKAPSLELYVVAGGNGYLDGNDLLWIGLACAVLAEFMGERNIPVQLHVIIETYFNGQFYASLIRIKSFTEVLDLNKLLLFSSDPRYYRFRGFKGIIALCDYFGRVTPSDFGTTVQGIGKEFIAVVNPKAILFENSYSLDSAVREVTSIITNYSKML